MKLVPSFAPLFNKIIAVRLLVTDGILRSLTELNSHDGSNSIFLDCATSTPSCDSSSSWGHFSLFTPKLLLWGTYVRQLHDSNHVPPTYNVRSWQDELNLYSY